MNAIALLRAKWRGSEPSPFHPLVCHMIDVASVCLAIWDGVLKQGLKGRLADALGLPLDQAGRWIAFWAGAHDLGKASPGFQKKAPGVSDQMRAAGFDFRTTGNAPSHGIVTTKVLRELLASGGQWPGISELLADRVATAIGGHHGVFPRTQDWINLGRRALGNDTWTKARSGLLGHLADALKINDADSPKHVPENDHAFFMILAGLTAVADWIGSAEDYFEFAGPDVDLRRYPHEAAERAQAALDSLGWTGWQGRPEALRFSDLFPRTPCPRPLQRVAIEQASASTGQGLVLIEAPTGEGKTEAALFLSDYWACALGQQGLYVALPTQATSNQMFRRVKEFLSHRYEEDRVNFHLLHGHALLQREYQALRLAAVHDEVVTHDGAPGSIVAEEWFTRRKRGLLAPFAVGTIDQALLAVLQTRHAFVRLFGLAGKTIILDEVHAYDAYMSTLLEWLLKWLAGLGSSVVVLSATLPRSRRRALLQAYLRGLGEDGGDLPRDVEDRYPRIEWVTRSGSHVRHVESSAQSVKEIHLTEIDDHPPDRQREHSGLAARLLGALSDGGCAAVICNTVSRAQEVFRALRCAVSSTDTTLILFHARFPFGDRDEIEKTVLDLFGKSGERPYRAVIVATQVIEQSLDLDFDLMATDWAPVDLLLQRAGRLHRHERDRPPALRQPQLWLLRPDCSEEGVPDFGSSEWVYPRHLLLRTWLALRGKRSVCVPADVEELVEAVYGDTMPEAPNEHWLVALEESQAELLKKRREHEAIARRLLVKPPTHPDDIMQDFCQQLEEDSPETHRSLQALTRLTEPTVTVVCLYRVAANLALDREGTVRVDLEREPDLESARQLLRQSLTLSHWACVKHFLAQETPPAWRRSSFLRHLRVAECDGDGTAQVANGFVLRLDTELGAVVERPDDGEPPR